MSYVALYRKYRPLTFSDIIGQENVTKILKNQIDSQKISHAYIFSGCRGTGKTSAAKVFARAINCLNPHDGEPCNECEVCKKILEGTTTDVVEMDAASNNSVDNIRQIRQEVAYSTVDTKYRIYIIDEAHMLTTSAFNALLKTLEEPPENVVFILATTEQHKIPITILSRCLKFEFRRLSNENIINRLEYVLKNEAIEYEKKAVEYIAKLADGALRDALSILDRCQSETKNILKYDDILKITGGIEIEKIQELISYIFKLDSVSSVNLLEEIIKSGRDLRQVNSELLEEILNILINKNNERKNYDTIDDSRIIKIIDRLSKLDNDLKYAISPEIMAKSCMVEICMPDIENKINTDRVDNNIINSLVNKINMLEEKLEKNSYNVNTQAKKIVEKKVNNNIIDTSKIDTSNICEKFTMLDELKKEIAKLGKLKLYSALANIKAYEKENILLFISNNKFGYEILNNVDNISDICEVANKISGKDYNIKIELQENDEQEESIIERVLKESGINYTNID